ncbi:MAG: response regulator [Cyanobacteria bacterium J06639_1]
MQDFSTDILAAIQRCSRDRLTGRLLVRSANDVMWTIFFFLGRAIGDGAGYNPVQRWRRQCARHCPDLLQEFGRDLVERDLHGCVETWLVSQRLDRDRAVAAIEGSLVEVLFDILQREAQSSADSALTYQFDGRTPAPDGTIPPVLVKLDYLWQQVHEGWQAWSAANMSDYPPSLAPRIDDEAAIQQATSANAFRNLSQLLDGRRSLRDIALDLNQEPLLLAKSLAGYCRKGWVSFHPVADRDSGSESVSRGVPLVRAEVMEAIAPAPEVNKPLIAHIDDSPLEGQLMERIVTEAGCRYLYVQEPMKALSVLLKQPPQLIFLDLVMPIANGYEVCAQLRRMSAFQDTPIVILTSSDGIVDRVRAKVVKATAFVSKPIARERVLDVIEKHLPRSVAEVEVQVPGAFAGYSQPA